MMKDIYNDGTYLKHNPTWGAEDAAWKASLISQLLNEAAISYATLAEVGCGSGEILVELSRRLPDHVAFFGFDSSADAISLAKPKETPRLRIEQADWLQEPNPTLHYDVLLVIDVLEHVQDYLGFLATVSTKATHTVFHIPLDMCVWTLFREKMLIESKRRVGHIHVYTEEFIKSVLKDYGFILRAQRYTEPTFQNKSFKQSLVNGLRKLLFRISTKWGTKILGGYSILVLAENPKRPEEDS
jgi:SAM-dependent methyltransferase